MVIAVEQVTPVVAGHGEGPCWFAVDQRVRWVDMLAGDVLDFDPRTGARGTTARRESGGCPRARARGGGS